MQLKRDNSPELLTKAEALFKEGKNAEARAEYMKVLAAHPELAGINRAIAFTYGREGQPPRGAQVPRPRARCQPERSTLLQLAAASATQLSDYPRAMAYLAKIDDATLDNPALLADAAVNLINKKRSADAITLLDRVIARFPTAADAYFYRGFAKLQAGKNAAAKADLEKFVSSRRRHRHRSRRPGNCSPKSSEEAKAAIRARGYGTRLRGALQGCPERQNTNFTCSLAVRRFCH